MARKDVEKDIKKFMTELTGGDKSNANRMDKFFKTLNDKQFKEWVYDVADPEKTDTVLYVITPTLGKVKLDVENMFALGEKYNIPIMQDIYYTDPRDGSTSILPHKGAILKLPVRRASQTALVQMKAAKHDHTVDKLTGQPTGDSASGSLSVPEMDIFASYGFDAGLTELANVNGGDIGAFSAFKRSLLTDGTVKLSEVRRHSTGAVSKATLKKLLRVQYVGTTL